MSQSLSNSYRWSWENTANYLFTVNDKHNFDVLLGQSIEKAGYGLSMSGSETNSNFTDFKHAYLSNVPFVNANVQSLSGGPNTPIRMASFFGRINYNYDERYMATVIVRADGSSKFARGHRWHTYPSISAGWVMSNEAFMEFASWWETNALDSWNQSVRLFRMRSISAVWSISCGMFFATYLGIAEVKWAAG